MKNLFEESESDDDVQVQQPQKDNTASINNSNNGINVPVVEKEKRRKTYRPQLDSQMLLGPKGLRLLHEKSCNIPLNGETGHELSDLKRILDVFTSWQREIYPFGENSENFAKKARSILKKDDYYQSIIRCAYKNPTQKDELLNEFDSNNSVLEK